MKKRSSWASGEGEGAFVFDGVLGGDDENRPVEVVGGAIDGDLAFTHHFKERRLGARGGAVDFVGEEDVGEGGAGDEGELALLLVVDGDAGDVVGEEVGGALEPFEVDAEGDGEGASQHGFADTGDIFEEDVAFAEEGDEELFDGGSFADDDLFDVVEDVLGEGLDGLHGGNDTRCGEGDVVVGCGVC